MDVNDARTYLMNMGAAANDFAFVFAGIDAGLFDAMAKHGQEGVSPATLAKEEGYFEDYVRIWCQSSYALQLLDLAGDGRFRIGAGFETLLPSQSPSSMAPFFRLRQLTVRERMEHPEFMRTGAVRTYQDHGEELSRMVADSSGGERARMRIDYIYKKVPPVAAKLTQGARVLEVGCGTGRLLQYMAEEFPSTTYVGVDLDSYGVELGNREAEAKGLGQRVKLFRKGAQDVDYQEEFDLVSLNLVMHELRADIRPQGVRNMWKALRPGGLLMSNDMYYPSRLEDFRKPEHRMAIDDQTTEAVWGNRHLSREGLTTMFRACGFSRTEFHLITLPGMTAPQLTALAYK